MSEKEEKARDISELVSKELSSLLAADGEGSNAVGTQQMRARVGSN
jgi:hypothetical protein